MKLNKGIVISVISTAVVTAIITSAVKDINYYGGKNGEMAKVSEVSKILQKYCLFDTDTDKMRDYALMGMAAAIEDPYTAYYPKEDFDAYKDNVSVSYVGIGAYLGADTENDRLVVISPMEDSPAEKAGMKSGDVIVSIDDKAYNSSQLTEAATYLKNGDIGTKVNVRLAREGKGELEITVTRDVVTKVSVKSKMLQNDIGYIRITGFESKMMGEKTGTYEDFCDSLEALKSAGMKSLVIDLRDNPGGDLNVVCQIADKLLPEGLITYTEDRYGKRDERKSDAECVDVPIAVLVNGGSASASEVLTGALHDNVKATLIGTKTYGKGIVQTVYPFADGSGMSITTAKYYVPSGVCIHEIGIEPDVKIEMSTEKNIQDLTLKEDVQLQKAIEILSR